MRELIIVLLLAALFLPGCDGKPDGPATPKDRECKNFMATAREGQRKLNAPKDPKSGSALQERAKRYHAYADELDAVLIRDAGLDALRDEYVVHVRGSAKLFETFLTDQGSLDHVTERDKVGAAITARLNTYCGVVTPQGEP